MCSVENNYVAKIWDFSYLKSCLRFQFSPDDRQLLMPQWFSTFIYMTSIFQIIGELLMLPRNPRAGSLSTPGPTSVASRWSTFHIVHISCFCWIHLQSLKAVETYMIIPQTFSARVQLLIQTLWMKCFDFFFAFWPAMRHDVQAVGQSRWRGKAKRVRGSRPLWILRLTATSNSIKAKFQLLFRNNASFYHSVHRLQIMNCALCR